MLLLLLHTMHACTNGPPNIPESTAGGQIHTREPVSRLQRTEQEQQRRGRSSRSRARGLCTLAARGASADSDHSPAASAWRAQRRVHSQARGARMGRGDKRARPVHGHMRTTRLLPFLHAPPPRWILLTSGPAAATGYTHVALLVSIAEVNSRSRTVLRLSARRQLNNACTREE